MATAAPGFCLSFPLERDGVGPDRAALGGGTIPRLR
jgi:hypothetical protein